MQFTASNRLIITLSTVALIATSALIPAVLGWYREVLSFLWIVVSAIPAAIWELWLWILSS